MATRQTFAHLIAGRARKIGWEVQAHRDGGWVIFSPVTENHPKPIRVEIHLTPSDVNHEQTVMRALNKAGFSDAEEEYLKTNEEERKAKIAALQAKEQRDLDNAQQAADERTKALLGASGVDVRIDQNLIISPYPMPKTFERVFVTPSFASKMLEKNTDNRPIRRNDVEHWKGVISRGEWRYTHQGIAFNVNGVLQDGQHRLLACVETELPIIIQISIGMPVENYDAVDLQTKRTYGDVAAKYDARSRNKVGSATRLIIYYDNLPDRSISDRVTNQEIDRVLVKNHQKILDAVNAGQLIYQATDASIIGAGAMVYLLKRDVGEDDAQVSEFLTKVKQGADLPEGDPILALRRSLRARSARNVRTGPRHLAMFIKGWNKWVTMHDGSRPVKIIAWRTKVEDFPKLIIPEKS